MLKSCHKSLNTITRLNSKSIKYLVIKQQIINNHIEFTLTIITKTAINRFIKAINWSIKADFLIIKNFNVITNPNIHIKTLIIKVNISRKDHIIKIVTIEWEINPMEVKYIAYRKRKVLSSRLPLE